MSMADHLRAIRAYLAGMTYVALPGGASVYLQPNVVTGVTVRYDVGSITYSGTVSRDAAGVIHVDVTQM